MKNRLVGTVWFYADERAFDLTTTKVAFRNFEKAPQKEFPLITLGPLKSAEVVCVMVKACPTVLISATVH
jgi:hypothetical protein